MMPDKQVYMSISFASIPEDKAQDIALFLVENTQGLSVNVHYDEPYSLEDEETYTENTLVKVRRAIANTGLPDDLIDDAITNIQNEGILFRERATEEDNHA